MCKNTAITYLGIRAKFHHTIKDTGFTAHTRRSPRRAYKKPSERCTILNSAFSFKEKFCSKMAIFFCVDTLLPIFWNLKWWATKKKLDFWWLCKAGIISLITNGNRPFAGPGHMAQNYIYWWASCTVGLPKQCTCLCFGSPTAQLAHQYMQFCTMWPGPAKGLLFSTFDLLSYENTSGSLGIWEILYWSEQFFLCVLPIFMKGFFNLIHLGTQKMFSVSFLDTMKKRRRDSRFTDEFVLIQHSSTATLWLFIYWWQVCFKVK